MAKPSSLEKTYALLSPRGSAETWKAEDFWKMAFDASHPKNNADMGYLVSMYEFTKDWDSWENHPNGDELVICVCGKITFVLEKEDETSEVELVPGTFVVVPRNTWHTARCQEQAQVAFITWGYGTKHRDVRENKGN